MAGSDPLLSVRGITVRFGGVLALEAVSFDVSRGGVCGLIGPNGAGKTTLFNCLSRLYRYQEGELHFDGQSLDATPVHRVADLGIGRTFQNLAMFGTMSVEQNVMVGAHCRTRAGFGSSALRLPSVAREEVRVRERARETLTWLGSTRTRTVRSATCRSACRSASNWRARWSPIRSCCCSTNRPPG